MPPQPPQSPLDPTAFPLTPQTIESWNEAVEFTQQQWEEEQQKEHHAIFYSTSTSLYTTPMFIQPHPTTVLKIHYPPPQPTLTSPLPQNTTSTTLTPAEMQVHAFWQSIFTTASVPPSPTQRNDAYKLLFIYNLSFRYLVSEGCGFEFRFGDFVVRGRGVGTVSKGMERVEKSFRRVVDEWDEEVERNRVGEEERERLDKVAEERRAREASEEVRMERETCTLVDLVFDGDVEVDREGETEAWRKFIDEPVKD